jgi:hypothetical protein
MSFKQKRFLIAMKKLTKSFRNLFQFPSYVDPLAYNKKYPVIHSVDAGCKKGMSLTPLERIYFLEKELHKIRCEVMENESDIKGRLTKEQCFFLCLYKKEIESIKSGYVY